jgi:hypothetical protein
VQCVRARRGHRARERSRATWWRGCRDLASGLEVAAAAALAPMEHGGVSGKTGQSRAQPCARVGSDDRQRLWGAPGAGGEKR